MARVFVTGASGFIGKHILRELFDRGYAVRASVRSEARQGDIEALFPGKDLDFAFLDLDTDDGWDTAMQGCDVLMHTASPFPMGEPKDPQELIRPAVDGTLRAMNAAKAAGIRRVVLTSSNAAIYKDAGKPKDQPSDERNWTTADAPFVSAYEASKTLAERAAWDFVAAHPEIALTTINPGGVFGPAMDDRFSTSLNLVERLMSGSDPLAPPVELPIVDVRDVAMMHAAALKIPATEGERFSATAETLTFLEMARSLKAWDPDLKVATKAAPGWLLKLVGLFNSDAKSVVQNIGRNLAVSGNKAESTFGFTFIPGRDTLIAAAEAVRAKANG